MKKSIILIFMILIFIASMGIGYFYLYSKEGKKENEKQNIIVNNKEQNEIISTESQEVKITPNTKITKVTYYKMCGHEIIEDELPDEEIVNLTKEEVSEKLKDFKTENFTTDNVLLYKEVNKTCNEHFSIGEENGQINIYKLNEEGEEELYETTNILIEYFPVEEQNEIKNKKEIIGKEELYRILENLES